MKPRGPRARTSGAPRHRLALAVVILLLVAMPQGVKAQSIGGSTGSFSGTASSNLVRVVASPEPAILLDPLFDPGVTMAQAAADSLGTSMAYAKSVFPGTLYGLIPGLGSLVGASVPVPANPLEVDSVHPSKPKGEQTVGAMSLRASSTETSSTGSATNGLDEAKASVVADVDTGTVESSAAAAVSAIRISDLFVLHGVRVSAEATRDRNGEVERESTLDVTAISVAGQRVALTPGTLELLGTPAELPLVSPIRSLLATLEGAGFDIEYVPATDLEDGVQSAALRIGFAVQPPQDAGFSGVETFRVVMTIGGAVATASSGSIGGPVVEDIPLVELDTPAIDLDVAPVPTFDDVATDAAIASPPTAAAPQSPPSSPAAKPALASFSLPGVQSSLAAFYPVLVLAAALVYGLARSSRHLGGDRP